MKAIILAAGSGERLTPMGWTKPKSLLQIGNCTLIENLILALKQNNIEEIVFVLGYEYQLILDVVKKHLKHFSYVLNEDFTNTNTINSLWLARDYINENFLYFNADVYFDPQILPLLLNSEPSSLAIEQGKCALEEVKVIVDSTNRIIEIGKGLAPKDCLGEFIGIGKFNTEVCKSFLESLHRYNEVLGQRNLFFEAAVNDILEEHFFKAVAIGNLKAIEIDFPEDYKKALNLFLDE